MPCNTDSTPFSAPIAALATNTTFEGAAEITMRATLECARAMIEGGPHAGDARLLRCVLCLRPSEGYERLIGIEYPSGDPIGSNGHFMSGTAWRCLVERRTCVTLDIHRGAILVWSGSQPNSLRDVAGEDAAPGAATRESMRERNATHIHLIPLFVAGGGVVGAISLELACPKAMGGELIASPWSHEMCAIATAAGPYLMALPQRSVVCAQPDEWLPVVGKTTSRLIELLRIFARQDETILLSGPTGVGKSRLARWCHSQSSRSKEHFEAVDLLSVPEDLQMGEIFGWKRGAFTGAMKDNAGAIGRADGGTVFIDEIDKLSLKAQSGLLRVLEDHAYRPLGDDAHLRRANVRFLVGTNVDLSSAVAAGRFREDLYYRISVLPVRIPPLSERLDEVAPWATFMAERHHAKKEQGRVKLDAAAIARLESAAWPGNLRQLDNVVRRAYALALAETRTDVPDMVIEQRHVQLALGQESPSEEPSLLRELWKAADAFSREAERRHRHGDTLSLDLADSFRGLVLGATMRRLGAGDSTFEILGQSHLLKNRNQYRVIRRELERMQDLASAVGDACPEVREVLELASRR